MTIELQRGAMPIELDRPRIVFFDMAATWLLVQRYGIDFIRELYTIEGKGATAKLKPSSADAVTFFLWAGLQAELVDTGETLALEEVTKLIGPWNFARIFHVLTYALSGATRTPAMPGKDEAAGAAAKPGPRDLAAARKGSITRRRSGSSAGS
jgi:hypothetical protein